MKEMGDTKTKFMQQLSQTVLDKIWFSSTTITNTNDLVSMFMEFSLKGLKLIEPQQNSGGISFDSVITYLPTLSLVVEYNCLKTISGDTI